MMLRYILVSDGTSDRALLPLLNDLLQRCHSSLKEIQAERADLSYVSPKPQSLAERIFKSIELYEPDMIFIHRDAERETREQREHEINQAVTTVKQSLTEQKHYVKVIPIRMTEAWLLFDEAAIKRAAGNPNAQTKLNMPDLKAIEKASDPKTLLETLLKQASGLAGRRLKSLNTRACIQQIPEFISDFSPLEQLSAYQFLKAQVENLPL